MSRTIEAIYEGGVFKPLEPLHLPEHARARVTVEEEAEPPGFPDYSGPLPRPIPFAAAGEGPEDLSERAEEYLAQYGFGGNKNKKK